MSPTSSGTGLEIIARAGSSALLFGREYPVAQVSGALQKACGAVTTLDARQADPTANVVQLLKQAFAQPPKGVLVLLGASSSDAWRAALESALDGDGDASAASKPPGKVVVGMYPSDQAPAAWAEAFGLALPFSKAL